MTRASLLAVVLLAASARADVWQRAVERGANDPSRDAYADHLQRGDDLVQQTAVRSANAATVRRNIDQAIAEYRLAADARPSEAEPYFRIGAVLDNFYVECAASACITGPFNAARALETVQAWDTFEKKAPMDPRVNEMLFERAIIRTKLLAATPSGSPAARLYLEGAARDYQALVDRRDGTTLAAQYSIVGNLAETYMMLDRLDDAIAAYHEAVRLGGPTSVRYGLAVALDRDEREAEAKELIVDQGLSAQQVFTQELQMRSIFFVPQGEEFYYFALVSEAFEQNAAALTYWNAYLQSGAHPEFQPRARQHIDALKKKPVVPAPPIVDETFP